MPRWSWPWPHPSRGFVSTAELVPFAEQTGYISMVTADGVETEAEKDTITEHGLRRDAELPG